MNTRIKMTQEKQDYIIRHFGEMSVREIAENLEVNVSTVRKYADRLGVENPNMQTLKTPVWIYYNRKGCTGSKRFLVNELDYHKACERVLDMAVNILKYQDVRVIHGRA